MQSHVKEFESSIKEGEADHTASFYISRQKGCPHVIGRVIICTIDVRRMKSYILSVGATGYKQWIEL